ncbi:hypothetical protein QUA56_28845 [Microcoleus sp. N3A4]|uniref:hypothetical protein n=1 Tax=Microcoleus sp. N3A4 TaxID=3055379 RepID=UPI002FCEF35C
MGFEILVTDLRCMGLGFHRPDFKLWLWCDLFDRAFNTQVLMRSNYTFHRRHRQNCSKSC